MADIGPEVAKAHATVFASFEGFSTAVRKEATKAAGSLGTTLEKSASSTARSAGVKAGNQFADGVKSSRAAVAFRNVVEYGGAYAAINGITNLFKAAGNAAIGTNAKLENTEIALNNITGSSAKARKELAWIKEFDLNSSLFDLPTAEAEDERLLSITHNAKLAHDMLQAAADASAGMGKGVEGVQGIDLALQQMYTKGKIQAQELQLQLGQYVNGVGILAQATGKTTAQITDLMSKGLLDSKTYVPLLVKGIEDQFHGLDKSLTKTLSGTWNNIKDILSQDIAGASTGGFNALKDDLQDFYKWLESPAGKQAISEFGQSISYVVQTGSGLVHFLHEATPALEVFAALWVGGKLVGGISSASTAFQVWRSSAGALQVAETELTAAKERETAAYARWSALAAEETTMTRSLIAAKMELRSATVATTAAEERQAVAMGQSGLRGAASGLLGLLGGPWGIALGAATAYGLSFASSQLKAKSATDGLTDSINAQTGALDRAGEKSLAEQLLGSYSVDQLKEAGYTVSGAVDALVRGGKAYEDLQRALIGTLNHRTLAEYGALFGGIGPLDKGGQLDALKDIENGFKNNKSAALAAAEANDAYGDSTKQVAKWIADAAHATDQFADSSVPDLTKNIADLRKQAHEAGLEADKNLTPSIVEFSKAAGLGTSQAENLQGAMAHINDGTYAFVAAMDARTAAALGLAQAQAILIGTQYAVDRASGGASAQAVGGELAKVQGVIGQIKSYQTLVPQIPSLNGSGSGGSDKSKPKYDPWAAFRKAFNASHAKNYMHASGSSIAKFLIEGFGDELNKQGKLTVAGLGALGVEKWSKGAAKHIRDDFRDALKDVRSELKNVKAEIKQGQQSVFSAYASDFFSAQGSTDYFGNTIKGSTGQAALAIAQADAARLKAASGDELTLNNVLGPKYNGFLNSLLASGNFGELSDLANNTDLAKSIGDAYIASQKAADDAFDYSPQGKRLLSQDEKLQTMATSLSSMVGLATALLNAPAIKNAHPAQLHHLVNEINNALQRIEKNPVSLGKV